MSNIEGYILVGGMIIGILYAIWSDKKGIEHKFL